MYLGSSALLILAFAATPALAASASAPPAGEEEVDRAFQQAYRTLMKDRKNPDAIEKALKGLTPAIQEQVEANRPASSKDSPSKTGDSEENESSGSGPAPDTSATNPKAPTPDQTPIVDPSSIPTEITYGKNSETHTPPGSPTAPIGEVLEYPGKPKILPSPKPLKAKKRR